MTAEIVQFVPGLKVQRFEPSEADRIAAMKFDQAKINQDHADTAPSEYVAPGDGDGDGDCA